MKQAREPTDLAEPFVPKDEVLKSKQKFDPNIRERPMEIDNKLVYRALYGIVP